MTARAFAQGDSCRIWLSKRFSDTSECKRAKDLKAAAEQALEDFYIAGNASVAAAEAQAVSDAAASKDLVGDLMTSASKSTDVAKSDPKLIKQNLETAASLVEGDASEVSRP
jgi:hypothetical protein